MNKLRLALTVVSTGLLFLTGASARADDPETLFSPSLNAGDISLPLITDFQTQMAPQRPVLRYCEEPDFYASDPGLRSTSDPACGILESSLTIADIWPTIIAADVAATSNASDSTQFKFDIFDFSINVPDDQRWTGELLGNGMTDVTGRGLSMYGFTGGGGVYFFRNMALLLDVTGYGFNLGHSNGAAVGVSLGLRHNLLTIDRTIIYGEVYGGEIEASNNIPRGGTHLNDMLQTGLGVAQPIAAHTYLTADVRYFHISNARAEGADRNPSANAVEVLIGVMWRF